MMSSLLRRYEQLYLIRKKNNAGLVVVLNGSKGQQRRDFYLKLAFGLRHSAKR